MASLIQMHMQGEEVEQEPSIDTDKLSYEIFSILESKFLFGYQEQKLWIPKNTESTTTATTDTTVTNAIRNQRGKVCILSIDGGGMRGIVSGKALAYLEQALKTKSGDPHATIADYFDVAAGTGIGGIFTAMLFATRGEESGRDSTKNRPRPIFRAEDTWKFLAEQGKHFFRSSAVGGLGIFRRIFKGTRSTAWETAGMERAMREAFTAENGRNLTLKDTLKPVLIPCHDLSSSAPFVFSRADAFETDSYNFQLWEVCRATSADPVQFGPVSMRSVDGQTSCVAVDGSLGMSNPAAAAITHVLHNKQEFPFVRGVEDVMVLSLGSGQMSFELEKVRGWKAKDWGKPMARISSDGAADLADHAIAMAFGHSRSSNYVRIQANGSNLGRCAANTDSDPSPGNVKMLIEVAEEMLKQKNVESVLFGGKRIGDQTNFDKLDWFAGELVLEHQRRSCRIAPTVAFKQTSTRTM